MPVRWVRRIVIVVFLGGIAGMIVGSIADNNGTAITFGLITAVAVLCLILVTAVTDAPPATPTAGGEPTGEAVEARIQALVDAGADETEVRALVQQAIDFGRRS